jgi:hypothetical protein
MLRGLLWISIAVVTEFLMQTKELTREKMAAWFWLDYVKLIFSCTLPGLVVWRTYVDQSLSQHKDENKRRNNSNTLVGP